MAHYAELGVDNVVKKVLYIDTIKCMTNGGIEQESIGREYLEKHHGGTWMKCSYNTNENEHREGKTPFRGNYPCGNGNWKYDSTLDKFCEISHFTGNINTCLRIGQTPSPSFAGAFIMSHEVMAHLRLRFGK